MSQRGIINNLLLYGVGAIAILGTLFALYKLIDHNGYTRGKNEVRLKWEEANVKAQKEDEARRKTSEDIARANETARKAAESKAAEFHQQWKEAVNEVSRQKRKLATVVCPKVVEAKPGTKPEAAPPVDIPIVLFTWDFVRLYDGVWTRTGDSTQPLFSYSTPTAPAGTDPPPSPYTAEAILETHGENARRFDACRRDLNSLIDQIEKLRVEWDRRAAAQASESR